MLLTIRFLSQQKKHAKLSMPLFILRDSSMRFLKFFVKLLPLQTEITLSNHFLAFQDMKRHEQYLLQAYLFFLSPLKSPKADDPFSLKSQLLKCNIKNSSCFRIGKVYECDTML